MIRVDPNTEAAEHGIKENDLIFKVTGKGVAELREILAAINAARADNKRTILFWVKSGETLRYLAVPLCL